MAEVTLYHNPRCSSSRAALALVQASGVAFEVVDYRREPLDRAAFVALLAMLPDAPGDLVRRDPDFAASGLTDADVVTADQVASVLAEHPALMQRPVLVRGPQAIIGRPVERVAAFLAT